MTMPADPLQDVIDYMRAHPDMSLQDSFVAACQACGIRTYKPSQDADSEA